MVKDKLREKGGFPGELEESKDALPDSASRARNRTVMLTPEMTGHVRASLNTERLEEKNEKVATKDAVSELLPPMVWESDQEPELIDEYQPVRPAETKISSQEYVSNQHIFSTSSGLGQGFKTEQPQAIKTAAIKHGDTLHDMDTQKQPSYTVNPSVSASSSQSGFASYANQPIVRKRKGKVVAFLISYDKDKTGEVYELSAGRWFITSKPTDHGEYILVDDETVSPSHAIIRATDSGKIHVLDQLSEYGTFITKSGADQEDEASGQVSLDHGYMIRFGNRKFIICLVPPIPNI